MEKRFLINRTRLKSQMALYGYKQQDLAKLLNVRVPTISDKMTGKHYFTEKEMVILRDRFGKTIFYENVG